MLFNSYIFILFFLPCCILGYFGLNHYRKDTQSQIFLLVMSLWFYAYFNYSYLVIILTSVAINFLFTRMLYKTTSPGLRRLELLLSVVFNFGILFYYKYYNFFLENLNSLFAADLALKNILLPLGISFFTFQQVSYVVDVYQGNVEKYPFLQYACFVCYFPQLIAGPIVTHDELIPQFLDNTRKKFNWENFERGIYIFVLGLAKKVLIADVFGNAANWGFANTAVLDTTNAALTALAYTIQIYFDFSGYCDMAIGIGSMMNIDLPVNFDSPYKALTITEFWDRWHKTLTRFFTRYIYIPLGGNRRGVIRTYLNIMVVFLCSGFWHGANWTFVLWGFLHGVFSVITRCFKPVITRLPKALNWCFTFTFVTLTRVLFRADSFSHAAELLGRLFSMEFGPVSSSISSVFLLPEFEFLLGPIRLFRFLENSPALTCGIFFGGAMLLILTCKNAYQHMQEDKITMPRLFACLLLLIWCIFSFSSVSTFLYFNF